VRTVDLVAARVDDATRDAVGWIALAIPGALGTHGCVRAFRRDRA